MSEPAQGWVQTVTYLSETQPYEKIVRLKLCVRTPTRDKTSRVGHFEDMLEMDSTEPLLYETEDRQARGQRQQQSGFATLGRDSVCAAAQTWEGEEGMNCLMLPTCKSHLQVPAHAAGSAVLANSATTAQFGAVAKNARVGRASGSNSTVKQHLTVGYRTACHAT